MTSKEAIKEAIRTVKFDKDTAVMINDKEYFDGYREVEKKLKEAMELMDKFNLI